MWTERLRFYPVESTFAGLPGNDGRLGDFSRRGIEERVLWLVDFHDRLMGLRVNALSQPSYLDALWLTSLVKAELFELEGRSLWTRSAAFYGDQILRGLVSLLVDSELEFRADDLGARLSAVPAVLESARENLVPAHDLWRRGGLESLERCRLLLTELPELLADRLPKHQVVDLAERARVATRAVQAMMSLLAQAPATEGNGFVLGTEGLERWFLYHTMLDWPPETLTSLVEAELENLNHEITEHAIAGFPSLTLAQLMAPAAPRALDVEVEEAQHRVLAFGAEQTLAGLPRDPLPVRIAPHYFPGETPLMLWRLKALEPARGSFLMVRASPRLDREDVVLRTLREVGARYRQFARQAASASLLRRVFSAPSTNEGWLAEFENRALDEGFDSDNPAIRLESLHRAMLDYLRLLAVVRVHHEGASIGDVTEMLRVRGFLSSRVAAMEVRRAALDPSVANAGLGRLLMKRFLADYARAHPLADPADFGKTLLSEDLLPMRLLRFRLLGHLDYAPPSGG